MSGFSLTGETQTRVFDFMRIKTLIGMELKTGMPFSSKGHALKAAEMKGYIPKSLISRGLLHKRREAALQYMEGICGMLNHGGFARQYAEEIICKKMVPNEHLECGCWDYVGTPGSSIILPVETAVMHICGRWCNITNTLDCKSRDCELHYMDAPIKLPVEHAISTNELRLSDCEYGCKVFGCSCGGEHVWHSAIYGCPIGRELAHLPTITQ